MFNFTTERIINSVEAVGKKTGLVNEDGKRVNFLASEDAKGHKMFSVYGGANFFAPAEAGKPLVHDVLAIKAFRHNYRAPQDEKVPGFEIPVKLLDGTDLKAGDVLRLCVYTTLENKIVSTYNDVNPIHIKPFVYEVCVKAVDATKLSEAFVKTIKEINGLSDIDFFYAEDKSGKIDFIAPDCHTRFMGITLERVGSDFAHMGNILTGYMDVLPLNIWGRKNPEEQASGAAIAFVAGNEGCGTVEHILHDLRIQTRENTDVFTINMDERPLPGGKYVQYIVEYTTLEHEHSLVVVGSKLPSITYHVFFVLESIAEKFEEALGSVVEEILPADADALLQDDSELVLSSDAAGDDNNGEGGEGNNGEGNNGEGNNGEGDNTEVKP